MSRDDIRADQGQLEELIAKLGIKESTVRKAGAWIAEKISRPKIDLEADSKSDLGLFLAHIMLKACRLPGRRQDYFDLTQSFWRGYREEVAFRSSQELEGRAVAHFAACLLARIDGTSPVDYLPEEVKREAVRSLSRELLRNGPSQWEEVLALAEKNFRSLKTSEV